MLSFYTLRQIFKGTKSEVWHQCSFTFDFPSNKNLGHSNLILTFPVHSTPHVIFPLAMSVKAKANSPTQFQNQTASPLMTVIRRSD